MLKVWEKKTLNTVKFSKFFISVFSYAGILVPSFLTLHLLNQSLKIEIPTLPDINKLKSDLQPIEPEKPKIEDDGMGIDFGYEEDGEEGEGDDEEFSQEEEEELEEPELEEKEEEKEPEKSEEGSQNLSNDGTLLYDDVAEWVKEALDYYKNNEQKNETNGD